MDNLLLLQSLENWYSKDKKRIELIELYVKNGHSGQNLPSLRDIDYAIVNYTKRNRSWFMKCLGEHQRYPFEIHLQYKSQLNAFSKDLFDPFRRGETFIFLNQVETTLCQLNFFRWLIENNILQWIKDNMEIIKKDMFVHSKISNNTGKKSTLSITTPYPVPTTKKALVRQFNDISIDLN